MTSSQPLSVPGQDKLKEIACRANAGDMASLAELRAHLDQFPEIWQKVGDLAEHVKEQHIRRLAPSGDHLLAESIRRQVDSLRKELASPIPSKVEKIAIDAVVNAWLDLHAMQLAYTSDAGKNLPMARYVILLRNSVQRRYDAAMKTLMLVKEKLPAIEAANREHLRQQGKIVPFPAAAVS